MRLAIAGEIDAHDMVVISACVLAPGGGDETTRLAETMNPVLGRLQAGSDAQRRFVGDPHHSARSARNLTNDGAQHARDRVDPRLHGDSVTVTIDVGHDGPRTPPADRARGCP
ncbi:hypothetical protein [Aeromicrobium sp.]|uniref:hypothetical protein n=1 Tax=Aeromicrobium sp. TaxID=1871063 RepID=UPI001994798F|nr:hypothetical protein [Aeromicrobium sp.]MBC7632839.1 hypothetical protein [Aeromicrobium sp.]